MKNLKTSEIYLRQGTPVGMFYELCPYFIILCATKIHSYKFFYEKSHQPTLNEIICCVTEGYLV